MILLKDLVETKIKEEFRATVILVQGDLNNALLASDFDNYFNFFYDRGDWSPHAPLLDNQKHPKTINDGIDAKGNAKTRQIYPIAILITDTMPGNWQKSAELDAYSMIYNFEVLADDYDYEDIMLIMSTHSEIYNQHRDATSFSSSNYSCIMSYSVPSFGSIQQAYGRRMFSSFMQFSMLFIKNGVLGNDVQLSLVTNTNAISAASMVAGEQYKIATLGSTTNWNQVAGTIGVTYAVGDIVLVDDSVATDGTVYEFLTLPFLTYSMTKSKLGNAETFQGEKIAKMLHNQQTLTFDIGLIYTKSTLTSQILADIFDENYLTEVYVLNYDDGTINRNYNVFLSDGSMVANIGEFITISSSWVIAKELN